MRVEDFVAVHHRHKVLCVGEVDDIVGVSRKHVDALDIVPAYLKFDYLIRINPALLDEAVAADYDEELPLGVVPMLAFRNTRL